MSEKEIEEVSRDGFELNSIKVKINPIYQNIFDFPNEDIFNKYYLNNFESNTDNVKSLPYYLIPVASSLRYLLKKKVEENLFVYKKDDQLYNHLPNASESMISSTQTALHYYEFEALLASSIAALTLTYLSVSSAYIDDIKSLNSLSLLSLDSNDKFTIEDNIQRNDQMLDQNGNYNNMYSHMRLRNKRSLELKNNEAIEILQKNSIKFKNAIHIFSEFSNILIMNSYMLQVLKLIEKLPSFSSFYSMYSYVWEGAYYSMIESFEIDNNKMVSSIFRNLFNVNGLNNSEKDNYINKLEKIYLRMLNAILESIGDLNITDKFGHATLDIAILQGNINMMNYLIENGEDVNKENEYGDTPLITACKKNNEDIVAYLIDHGADVNKQNQNKDTYSINKEGSYGDSPLTIACRIGNKNIVKILIENGADSNKKNQHGNIPINIAIENHNEQIANYLIEHGADIFKEDKGGYSSLNYAVKHQNKAVLSYINNKINTSNYYTVSKKTLKELLKSNNNNIF